MSKMTLLGLITLSVVVTSCGSTEVVGRYREATCIDYRPAFSHWPGVPCREVIPEADVSIVMAISAPLAVTSTSGVDLPERAQAAYIQALSNNKMSPTAADLRKHLAATIRSRGGPSSPRDVSVFSGTLIITVSKTGPFSPADRLERTEVKIVPVNAKIQSWDAVQTAYTMVNAGTIQSTLQKGGELELGVPSSPTLPVGITGKATVQATRSDQLTVLQRVEDVTPLIDANGTITILRNSGFGLDLTGNTLLTMTLAVSDESVAFYKVFLITNYRDENGKWLLPAKLDYSEQTIKAPRGSGPIMAKVTLTYTLRHATSGDTTYQEKDDYVQEITRTTEDKLVILIPADKVVRTAYGLYPTSGSLGGPLFIQIPGRRQNPPLCFDSFENAQDLLDYLNRLGAVQPSTLGSASIGFSVPVNGSPTFSPLEAALVRTLEVRPGCQPS